MKKLKLKFCGDTVQNPLGILVVAFIVLPFAKIFQLLSSPCILHSINAVYPSIGNDIAMAYSHYNHKLTPVSIANKCKKKSTFVYCHDLLE